MNGVELCSKSLGDPADPPILLSDDGLCKIPVVCALGEPDQRGASRSGFMDSSRRGATISRVRLWFALGRFALGTSLSAFLLTGCGRGERASWEGPTLPLPTSGSLPVAGFARYVDAISEPWERSPVGLATAYALPLVRASGDVHATFPANDPEGQRRRGGDARTPIGRLGARPTTRTSARAARRWIVAASGSDVGTALPRRSRPSGLVAGGLRLTCPSRNLHLVCERRHPGR